RGETEAGAFFLPPPDWFDGHDVELRSGVRAESLDLATKTVHLDDGEPIPYERLLLATGGRKRTLTLPGSDLDGIFQLRTIEECDQIKAAAAAGGRVAIVGAGFIGMEVAASLRSMGAPVEVVEVFGRPFERVLGPAIGAVFQAIHEDHG